MKKCLYCDKKLIRNIKRSFKYFSIQKFCNRKCYFKSRIGYKLSEKTKQKISNAHKGIKFSQEHKRKLSISHLGKLKGFKNPNWNGGKTKSTQGYIKILANNHPFADKYGYVYKHRLVMEKHLGRYLKPKEVIHHINGNLLDNRIKNLKLFINQNEHIKFHKL